MWKWHGDSDEDEDNSEGGEMHPNYDLELGDEDESAMRGNDDGRKGVGYELEWWG